MSGYSLPMTTCLHRALQPKTENTCASPCEGLCAPPVGWVASVHLRKIETRCWSLCARLWQGAVFLLEKLKCQSKQKRREVGQAHPASRRIFWPWQHPILFRRNAQAKARQRARKNSGINFCHIYPQCGQLLFGSEGSAG